MCDGTADCDSGEDETNLLCASEYIIFFYLSIPEIAGPLRIIIKENC